jgi:hypothetical protein
MEIRFSFKDQYHAGKEGSTTMIMHVNNISDTLSTQLSMTGSSFAYMPIDSSSVELYTIDQTTYMYSTVADTGELTCTRMLQDLAMPPLNPNHLIGTLHQARLINKGATISGLMTDHYVLDNPKTFFGEIPSVETALVHFWVAQDGGYMVKLDAEATGTHHLPTAPEHLPERTPEVVQGTFILSYLLSDIDQPRSIELPELCTHARDGIPPQPTPETPGESS